VIGVVAVLATAIIIAVNPLHQLAAARDSTRLKSLSTIQKAINQYQVDHKGAYPNGLVTKLQEICNNDVVQSQCLADGKLYLGELTNNQEYLTRLPVDDLATSSLGTGYQAAINSAGRVVLSAMYAELASITVGDPDSLLRDFGTAEGLVGWWMLNDLYGAKDLSGYGKNGNLFGGVATSTGMNNKINGSYDFLANLVVPYAGVSIPSTNIHDVGTAWTMGAWFYNNLSSATGTMQTILTRNGQSQPNYGHWWIIAYSNKKLLLQINNGINVNLIWSAVLISDQWQHLVLRMNNDNAVELFVNNIAKGKKKIPGVYKEVLVRNSISLGAYNGSTGPAYRLGGKLADVRIYNRPLSNQEISGWYNATKTK